MAENARQYDLIVLGATGYTGRRVADCIVHSLPTDLRWALAGRSDKKIMAQQERLKHAAPDRSYASSEILSWTEDNLEAVARKTTVLINVAGPYTRLGREAVAACVKSRTHYIDVAGESPFISEVVKHFDEPARQAGVIIIPQCGVESAPADVLTFQLTSLLRESYSLLTREVVLTSSDFLGIPSGGSQASLLAMYDSYRLDEIERSRNSSSYLSSETASQVPHPEKNSLFERVTSIRQVPELGILCNPFVGAVSVPLITRTWSLLQKTKKSYGSNFRYRVYSSARNMFTGIFFHIAVVVFSHALALRPARWLLHYLATEPGDGPERPLRNQKVEHQGLAVPDREGDVTFPRAWGRVRWEGNGYDYSAMLVAQAAATLVYNGYEIPASDLGGGVLTPACLGEPYVDRLRGAGIKMEMSILPKE